MVLLKVSSGKKTTTKSFYHLLLLLPIPVFDIGNLPPIEYVAITVQHLRYKQRYGHRIIYY